MSSEPATAQQASTPRRVCMVVPSYWEPVMGGAQYQAKILLERMAELGGYDLHYLARRLPDDCTPATHGLHRIGTSQGMYFLKDAPTLLSTLNSLEPDTIYCHVGSAYVGIAAWYCRQRSTRLVWHLASDIDAQRWSAGQRRNPLMSWVDKQVMNYGLRRADAVIAQTEHQADLLRSNYAIEPAEIVKNFHPDPADLPAKTQPPEVLWVANLKTVKQPMKFVELAKSLADTDATFTMLGGMQLEPEQERELAKALAVTPNLRWLGGVSQDEVNDRLGKACLLVNTSSYEGFSNTFIQAWQREVPVCSLNVDPDKLLTEGELGACAHGDDQTLANGVRRFLQDHNLRTTVGRQARIYAREHHGMAAADRLIAHLN